MLTYSKAVIDVATQALEASEWSVPAAASILYGRYDCHSMITMRECVLICHEVAANNAALTYTRSFS